MAQASRTGFWRSLRDLPGRTPLRVKLMSAVLALVAIALLVISVAGIQILKSTLLGPYDSELQGQIGVASGYVSRYLNDGRQQVGNGVVDWIPAGGAVHRVVIPVSQGYPRFLPGVPRGGQPVSEPVIPSNPAWVAAHLGKPFTLTSQNGSIRWRVLMQMAATPTGKTGTVVLALDATSVYTTTGKLTVIDLLVSLAVIALIAVLGIGAIRASLRPLTDIEKTAGAIADGDLSRRVPERDPRTEVGRLGRSLNAMLSQIETAFRAQSQSEAAARKSEERLRQFVADASHELRTPLTAIRGFGEYYRQRGGVGADDSGQLAPADMDRIMRRVEQESARMGILVEDMLLLARLDQQRPLEAQPVDLLTLAADAVHDARVVAPGRSIHLTVRSGRAMLVIGDEVRLRQVIGNLMSNALTHTPDGTPIDVLIRPGSLEEADSATATARPAPAASSGEPDGTEQRNGAAPGAKPAAWTSGQPAPPPPAVPAASAPSGPAAILEVSDSGPGLTKEQAEHVFERFYRADAARTEGGNGLGLAIVAALVAAHGGTTWVRSQPGQGATFGIALPLSPDAMQDSEDDFDSDSDEIAETETAAANGSTAR